MPPLPTITIMRKRPGFTMIEMLVVLVIAGVIMVMALPKLSALSEKNGVRAAKQQLQSYIVVGRAAAIRRGLPAQFRLSSNIMWVTATTSTGGISTVQDSVSLINSRKVSVTVSGGATSDSIVFNTRGFATNLTSTRTYVITRGAVTDSVCVSKLGMIASRCGI